MVAGSRSSLRRPILRGDEKLSRPGSPVIDDRLSRPQSISNLHPKRARTSTLSDREQAQKRRKLASRNRTSQLRIPLRSRVSVRPVVSPKIVTQGVSVSEPSPPVSQINKPIDSPTSRPQYDQIRLIEEQARASIRGGGSSKAHAQDERRKLRSEHGGSRSKTELSQYFPNFDEMLSLEPPDPESLTAITKVMIIDDTPDYHPPKSRPDPFGSQKSFYQTEVLRFSASYKGKLDAFEDPMDEEYFLKFHRKAERHEKQMKNGDRERAQHEKYQLERLLEDLRGPDWLKTLGISGITDTEKKRYEPKRILFIRETQALIVKFKWWKEEEKRRKVERDQALMEDAADDEDEGDISESESDNNSVQSVSTQAPNSSEIDALASQQLIEEAKFANKRKKPIIPEVPEIPVHKPFVSFFSKRHLRDAAVSGRQRGRTILAFGYTVPELENQEFELPDTILTGDAIRASQRYRRRLRRGIDE